MIIRQQYEDHDISFTLSLDENIRPILGNQFKLEQVILNLITNARDAIDEKFIDAHSEEKQISITTIQEKQFAYIKISDNGIGIQKNNIDHIFEPFYTTKDPEKGTGLGLSVSYGILEEMNAEISVSSKPNLFTTFTIKFETTSA